MKLINRSVVVVKPRQPFFEWVIEHDAYGVVQPGSLHDLQQDCLVVLVPDSQQPGQELDFLEPFKPRLFEMQLDAWFTDPRTWPATRDAREFDRWFDLEVHTMVWDLAGIEFHVEDER